MGPSNEGSRRAWGQKPECGMQDQERDGWRGRGLGAGQRGQVPAEPITPRCAGLRRAGLACRAAHGAPYTCPMCLQVGTGDLHPLTLLTTPGFGGQTGDVTGQALSGAADVRWGGGPSGGTVWLELLSGSVRSSGSTQFVVSAAWVRRAPPCTCPTSLPWSLLGAFCQSCSDPHSRLS